MFAEDLSEDRKYHFDWILEYFWIASKSFAEDCFLLRSFRLFLPSVFVPLSCFQEQIPETATAFSSFLRKVSMLSL